VPAGAKSRGCTPARHRGICAARFHRPSRYWNMPVSVTTVLAFSAHHATFALSGQIELSTAPRASSILIDDLLQHVIGRILSPVLRHRADRLPHRQVVVEVGSRAIIDCRIRSLECLRFGLWVRRVPAFNRIACAASSNAGVRVMPVSSTARRHHVLHDEVLHPLTVPGWKRVAPAVYSK